MTCTLRPFILFRVSLSGTRNVHGSPTPFQLTWIPAGLQARSGGPLVVKLVIGKQQRGCIFYTNLMKQKGKRTFLRIKNGEVFVKQWQPDLHEVVAG